MTVLAHPGHWLVDAAYVLPVAAFLVWLGINELRTRRAKRAEGEADEGGGGSSGVVSPPPERSPNAG
ncbi:MAG: hypothetical protein GXY03_02285 [Solirubrobacterales bacterium]|nr:hypothetical protein [Solirubrobacterales bacterium]